MVKPHVGLTSSTLRKEHRAMGCGYVRDPHNGDGDCSYEPAFECDKCMFASGLTDKRKGKDPLAVINIDQKEMK